MCRAFRPGHISQFFRHHARLNNACLQEGLFPRVNLACPSMHGSQERESIVAGENSGGSAAIVGKRYQLDHSVRVWSDFLRVHLHPKYADVPYHIMVAKIIANVARHL